MHDLLKVTTAIAIVASLSAGLPERAFAVGTRYVTTVHFPRIDNGRRVRSVRVVGGIQLTSAKASNAQNIQNSLPLRAIGDFPLIASADPRSGFFRFVLFKGDIPEKPSRDQIEQGIWVKFYVEYDDRPGVFEEKSSPLYLVAAASPPAVAAKGGTVNSYAQVLSERCQALCQFPPNVNEAGLLSFKCNDPGNRLCPEGDNALLHPCCRDFVIAE